jgi:hypothetical protein
MGTPYRDAVRGESCAVAFDQELGELATWQAAVGEELVVDEDEWRHGGSVSLGERLACGGAQIHDVEEELVIPGQLVKCL